MKTIIKTFIISLILLVFLFECFEGAKLGIDPNCDSPNNTGIKAPFTLDEDSRWVQKCDKTL